MSQIFYVSIRTETSEKTAYFIMSDEVQEDDFWIHAMDNWPEFCKATEDLETYWRIEDSIPKGAKVFSAYDLDETVGQQMLESCPFVYSVFLDDNYQGDWTPKSGLRETDSFFEEFPSLAPYKEAISFMEFYGYGQYDLDEDSLRSKLEMSMRVEFIRKGKKTSAILCTLDNAIRFVYTKADRNTPVTIYDRKGDVVLTATYH